MPKKEEEIIKEYRKKLKGHIEEEGPESITEFSKEYITFREESLSKQTTRYENLCNSLEKIIQIKPPALKYAKLEEAIETAHLNITPIGSASFAIFTSVLIIFIGLLMAVLLYLITEEFKFFFPLALIIFGTILLKPLSNIPIYLADRWRLKASNQMVLCILYVAMYMRHTSNLEHAIKFAAEHIEPPLSLDLRKIFWDIETGRFSNIKDSLNNYLENWRHYNLEFINAFHLIESSLYEPSESRRLDLLDKSLDVMLEGTYEKMLHYAQELKNPITMLHMLGVVLPILGLVVFPLVGSFLGGLVRWYHVAFLYNLILPIIVFTIGLNVLSKRPTGYGESQISKELLETQKKPTGLAFFIAFIFLAIAFFPLLVHAIDPAVDISLGDTFGYFLGYQDDGKYGPFGIGALILSFFIPLGLAFSLSFYFKTKTKHLIGIRNETKDLEKEFASSLFQLGTRLGDGVPAEVAFSNVAENMEGTPTGNFFRIVDANIRNLGMGIKEAIFNNKTGAVMQYPSAIVQSSMEVLLESSKKGPKVASQALISISRYIERIQQVNERLKDLLSEVISSMKSQISFLTPAIAGIVVGIASMIVNVIVQLGIRFQELKIEGELGVGSQLGAIQQIFKTSDIIPGFFFQFVVGLYVVQIVYILTSLANGIENGDDKLNEQYLIGKNILKSVMIYVSIAAIVVLLFNLLAVNILKGTQF